MHEPRSPWPRRVDLALLILRVIVGIVFVAHGAQKLFVFGLDGVTSSFQGRGIPMPGYMAPLITFAELLGGIALIVGLLTRIAAAGLAIHMLATTLVVHLPQGFFVPGGVEFTLTLFAAAVALALAGPGAFSLDALLRRRRRSP